MRSSAHQRAGSERDDCAGIDTSRRRPARPASMLPRYKLHRAIDYIDRNLGRDVTLSEMAQTLGMSPHHFAHVFKRTTGLAPHQYLVARRVARAESLLLETDLPITEIAHRVGYANQSHFSTVFHRAAAMTPRMFRQQR